MPAWAVVKMRDERDEGSRAAVGILDGASGRQCLRQCGDASLGGDVRQNSCVNPAPGVSTGDAPDEGEGLVHRSYPVTQGGERVAS